MEFFGLEPIKTSEIKLEKRPALHKHPQKNDFYVRNNSPFVAIVKRIHDLLYVVGWEKFLLLTNWNFNL